MSTIYKILTADQWSDFRTSGRFAGAPIDRQDGFIHLSSGRQLRETLEKHFAGQNDLVILAFHSDALGEALRWEVSRGGALFPHLYASLVTADVAEVLAASDRDLTIIETRTANEASEHGGD
ncbi:MAG: DUF952 domain-containing protein [Planctomycetota bacterium]